MMEASVSKWHLNSSSAKLESLHSMLSRDSSNKYEVSINKTNFNYCKHQQRNNFLWTSTLANLPIQPDAECMLERKSKYERELVLIENQQFIKVFYNAGNIKLSFSLSSFICNVDFLRSL